MWLLLGAALTGGDAAAQASDGAGTNGTAGTTGASEARPVAVKSKIYQYRVGGTVTFSDQPPLRGGYVVWRPSCFACKITSSINWRAIRLHVSEFAESIEGAAQAYDVEPALVRAVIHAESDFNPRARSNKGAAGLMQLMPGTARMLGVSDVFTPANNIQGGVLYLAGLLKQFRGNVDLAVAAYNAGPEAVKKYNGIPPYAETQVYVERVKILHERYRERH
jgi:hypothetical protein